eukprot:TRINITY_DN67316_c0_g1_i1.p1 TRINITY_DN67316_c0_g1~~TRINITY_DN67316_c0_g1_i1.p1  ORF type:complete len:702 (-),score=138.61 TRINITY_DN67316_c0_g1_i1:98-2203(-)
MVLQEECKATRAVAKTSAKVQGPLTLTRDKQVSVLLALLDRNGRDSVKQLSRRLRHGEGVVAKGVLFDVTVCAEAIKLWNNQHPQADYEETPLKTTRTPVLEQPSLTGQRPSAVPVSKAAQAPATSGASPKQPQAASPGRKRRLSEVSPANVDQVRSPAKRRLSRKVSLPAEDGEQPAKPSSTPASLPQAAKSETPKMEKPSGSTSADASRVQSSGSTLPETGGSYSIKELKTMLSARGVDTSSCVEKSDLQALWESFTAWTKHSLSELQETCQLRGGTHFNTVDECARYLATHRSQDSVNSNREAAAPKPYARTPSTNKASTKPATPPSRPPSAAAAAKATPTPPAQRSVHAERTTAASAPTKSTSSSAASPVDEAADRQLEARKEVSRILPMGRTQSRYNTALRWGLAVLEVSGGLPDLAAVNRQYRALMRKLHPDRVKDLPNAGKAVEIIRQAKDACERGLSNQEPPGPPRFLKSEPICSIVGRRRIQLSWQAPTELDNSPIRRYVIQAMDPGYGKYLTVTVLEPDYSQELRRFVSVDELTSYVMSEEDLQKMPKLWTQSSAQVQVCAANEAGQSTPATLQVPLNGSASRAPAAPKSTSSFASAPSSVKKIRKPSANTAPPAPPAPKSGPDDESARSPMLDQELKKPWGDGALRAFLTAQAKVVLAEWLRSLNWSTGGAKQDLVERIIFVRKAMGYGR